MDIKSNSKKVAIINIVLLFIIGCHTTKKAVNTSSQNFSSYQKDSVKYGKDVADFIVQFDSIFHFDSLGNLYAVRNVDSFLEINSSVLGKTPYPTIIFDSNKIKRAYQCKPCKDYSLVLQTKEFRYLDTLRQLGIYYGDSVSDFKGYIFGKYPSTIYRPHGLTQPEMNRAVEEITK